MVYKKNQKKNILIAGFTLVEMMVSVAIFFIIVTVGMGSLVNITQKYKVSQEEKQAADTLNFVLESLTREIRLGSNYYVGSVGPANKSSAKNGFAKVSKGNSDLIGFNASDSRGYMVFSVENGVLYRKRYSLDSSGNPLSTAIKSALTDASQVNIVDARMTIMNAQDPDDSAQPLVWIQFLAHPPARPDSLKVIQTLVSQRQLDV